ncbi:RED family protein, putative [Babesia ovis]|uniref:RED family protein, putative n=1 Tax=Babesia ovis TaxID=5869 RepID=A0A9W5TAS8_BABOV|nr:RED family protein, putative [Babesia ovis]
MATGGRVLGGRRKNDGSQSYHIYKHDRSDARKRHATAHRRDDVGDHEPEREYRNRALERSQLKDEYYRKVVEEHALLKTQTEEESRYMGGDEEHTHLVKGLDYVLLEKVRRSLVPKVTTESKEQDIQEVGHTELGSYIQKTFLYHTHMHHRHFRDRLFKTYDLLCKGYKLKRNVVGTRTFYNFNLRMEPCSNDVPPTIVSNEDIVTSSTNAELRGYLEPEIRKEITEAFEWHHENRKKPKEKRLPVRPRKGADGGSGDDSDDIFADAGEYRSDELNTADIAKLNENEKYFGDSDDEDNADEGYAGGVRLPTFSRRERRATVTDGYDECYPMAADVDSDDDMNHVNKKVKNDRSEWRKIEKLVADKNTLSMDQLEQISTSKKTG